MVVFEMSDKQLTERTDKMVTSTRITASLMDAINKHPQGFTMDVNTGEVITHGIAVGGYHQEDGDSNKHWLQWDNDGASFTVSFEVLKEVIELWLPRIKASGFIGGWVVNNVLILDIVKVFDCIACFDDATAEPFHVAKDNEQVAVGWLCPDWSNGYKEVLI